MKNKLICLLSAFSTFAAAATFPDEIVVADGRYYVGGVFGQDNYAAQANSTLISLPASSQADSQIYLEKGLNSIDLNDDGIPDTVFSATYDNNTSHPSETLNIFISRGKNWFIVPVPDDDGFTWADLRLSASALKISGTELHRYKGRVYLIRAVKYADSTGGGDLTDKSPVRFSRFRLEENNDNPGTSVFYWDPAGTYLTQQTFDEVNEAFQLLEMEKFR